MPTLAELRRAQALMQAVTSVVSQLDRSVIGEFAGEPLLGGQVAMHASAIAADISALVNGVATSAGALGDRIDRRERQAEQAMESHEGHWERYISWENRHQQWQDQQSQFLAEPLLIPPPGPEPEPPVRPPVPTWIEPLNVRPLLDPATGR